MENLKFIFIATLLTSSSYGQSLGPYVISSAGEDLTSEEGELYVSVGEALSTELTEGDLMVSQGFLQIIVNGNAVSTEQWLKEKITIYPNPASTFLVVETENNTDDYLMQLVNSVGQSVMTKQLHQDTRIEIEGLPEGMYFLTIYKDGLSRETIKIFKTK